MNAPSFACMCCRMPHYHGILPHPTTRFMSHHASHLVVCPTSLHFSRIIALRFQSAPHSSYMRTCTIFGKKGDTCYVLVNLLVHYAVQCYPYSSIINHAFLPS